ncbi:ribose-phosphate pyrophosphokinase [Paenibacillus daejeonensis]|uniref:ribose-phosphate pyrophosphokinase n=1 Tax=Paenibacillus daejeonensis TaxID=135193 RepID=UPI0003810473|nr:ribose-phosphate pyrophosphokinase [Paenibacillus daejeonensis]
MLKLNGQELTFHTFPNGETLVDGEQILAAAGEKQVVEFKYATDGDLIQLMFLKRYLDERRLAATLIIYYMPYSRMDRVEGASAFTLKYTTEFINALGFERVQVIEPHSDVTTALLDRAEASYPSLELLEDVIARTGFDREHDVLFFPDAGAQKRYSRLHGYRELVGFKVRDFQTGTIQRLDVIGEAPETGFKAIIVDDLCSYGGTFLLSAEKLKELGAAEIYLLVAHCETSIHKGKLLDSGLIDKVFTTNTILDEPGHDLIHIYPIR